MGMWGGFGRGFGSWGPGGYGPGMYGGLTTILFIILIGLLVYMLIKRSQNSATYSNNLVSNEALEIAKLRYVRGEITQEEYQQIVKVIRS